MYCILCVLALASVSNKCGKNCAQAFTEDGATMQANSVPDIVSQKIKANTGHASVWVALQTTDRIAQDVAAIQSTSEYHARRCYITRFCIRVFDSAI